MLWAHITLAQIFAVGRSKHVSGPQRGFTLIELVVVLILLSILSAVSINLLSSSDQYTARLSADKWLTFFRLGQRMALLKQNATNLVQLTLTQNTNEWTAVITQGADVLQDSEVEREDVQMFISSTDFASACAALPAATFPQSFYFDGDGDHVTVSRAAINNNVRICFSGSGQVAELCLSPSGYIYSGACVP